MLSRPDRYLFAVLALLLLVNVPAFAADEESKDEETLTQLAERHKNLITKIQELRREYPAADLDRKKEIEEEFEGVRKELQANYERSVKVATAVFKQDPANGEAADVLLGDYYQRNRYADAAKVADAALKAGNNSRLVLNVGGAANFAIHNFKRAKELLTQAKKEDLLVPQIAANYLELSDAYQEFWAKEQKIRAAEKKADDLPRVEFDTTKGRIVVELFENEAPNTVANFISLVEKGFYDGIAFHRVIPNFMTQGGDPNTLDSNPANDGSGGPGYTIACECYVPEHRMHFQGSLSMAHAGRDTGGSQFFLTHLPTDHLNGKHTVFGRIIEGMDVNASMEPGDKIKSAKVLRKREHPYEPKTQPGR